MWKDFSRHPGEHIVTWLLRCWDNGASSLELEGKEAKQLGSLARDGGIDKAIGKKEQILFEMLLFSSEAQLLIIKKMDQFGFYIKAGMVTLIVCIYWTHR